MLCTLLTFVSAVFWKHLCVRPVLLFSSCFCNCSHICDCTWRSPLHHYLVILVCQQHIPVHLFGLISLFQNTALKAVHFIANFWLFIPNYLDVALSWGMAPESKTFIFELSIEKFKYQGLSNILYHVFTNGKALPTHQPTDGGKGKNLLA